MVIGSIPATHAATLGHGQALDQRHFLGREVRLGLCQAPGLCGNRMRGLCTLLVIFIGTATAFAQDDRFQTGSGAKPAQASEAKHEKSRPAKSDTATAAKPARRSARKLADETTGDGKSGTANGNPSLMPSTELQGRFGWRLIEDAVTHVRLGLPAKLLPQTTESKTGTRWTSVHGEVQIETFRVTGAGTTLAAVFEQQKKSPANRRVESNSLRPDSFSLSGLQGLKNFQVRAQFKDGEVRGLTILHDQAWEGIMTPVVAAMWNAFAPFADYTTAAISVPYRRKVEYGTGTIVSGAGHIVTDRLLVDGCSVILVAGHGNADRVAEDQPAEIALLRLYGTPNLTPLTLGGEAPKGAALTIVGIADPQAQGGGGAVTATTARLANNDTTTVEPSPVLGFAGATALDSQGHVVGIVNEKAPVVAGPAPAASQAALVPAATILKFLEREKVSNGGGRVGLEAAKASVVRVICVRK
jgi:hypothetical protein